MNKNRELKFRVWNIHTKKWMTDWTNEFAPTWCKEKLDSKNYIWQVREGIFQQFTGLKDKMGKDIYEGDIMASRGNYMTDLMDENGDYLDIYSIVVWNKKMTRFTLKPIDEYLEELKNPINPELDHPWVCPINTFKEVIGNICENPDMLSKLLKKQKEDEEKARKNLEDITDECEACEQYAVIDGFCNHCGYEQR